MTQSDRQRVPRRPDDFQERRRHLAHLSDEDLEKRFWELTAGIVRPLVDLARAHTSPAIERSVLLRMGFSSIEAKGLVDGISERGLLGKGAGNVVLRLARAAGMDVRAAGLSLLQGHLWDKIPGLFSEGGSGS